LGKSLTVKLSTPRDSHLLNRKQADINIPVKGNSERATLGILAKPYITTHDRSSIQIQFSSPLVLTFQHTNNIDAIHKSSYNIRVCLFPFFKSLLVPRMFRN
jgi:hypothetical protein